MRRIGRLLVVVLVLAVLPGVAGAQTGDLQDRLADREAERERVERRLDEARAVEGDARARLAAADRALEATEAELAALEGELAAAEEALVAARERAQAARLRLAEVNEALEETEAELAEKRGRLEARIRAAFKYGHVSFAEAFVGVRDISDFINSSTYVGHVLSGDRELVDAVEGLLRSVEDQRVEAQRLRAESEREAEEADRAAREVEEAAAQQQRLVEQVASQRAEREDALEALREDRRAIEGHLAGLEAESRRIPAQLAEIARQQEEARLAAERAAQEARERAEAEGEEFDEDAEPAVGGLETWIRPVPGHVTSPFGPRWGRMHNGVDLAGDVGTPVVASQPGIVVYVTTGCHPTSSWGCGGGFGNYVTVVHAEGMATIYAHLSSVAVGVGQEVAGGATVGAVGNSGNSYGPHLHFETRLEGVPQNPCNYISC